MTIKIKEPWWGAWKKFGWSPGTWGIGLDKQKVDATIKAGQFIKVNVWKFKTDYVIEAEKVKKYATKNDTMFTARNNAQLYVIPSTMLEKNED